MTKSARSSQAASVLLLALLVPGLAAADEPAYPTDLYKAMEWRFVGPYRGGRVTAVTGVVGRPHTFYMGATGGGVWKTESAGHTWTNLSDDHFQTTTIGAVAVAPSDPNVVYVGTGESPIRGVTTSHGDGVYKSTDAGKTWSRLGLASSRQISAVRVHPRDHDLVYVAAQGNPWGAGGERGVYRSRDGGASWERVLWVDEETGAVDLSMDAANPRVLYAAMWEHRRSPWFVKSGGPGSGIHKSVDGGSTWTKLGGGLPELMGKIGVAVSPADPERVYAIVEAEEGGLYRSDDAGETWTRVNSTRVIQARSWYYHHVTADPSDAETVYVLNVPMMKSIDGGKTFEQIRGPHGDHHDLWIDPHDSKVMVSGNDGGATVTLDGGETWSTLDNQPTAQIYRVVTDARFPYYMYGGQQDNSTLAIASRSAGGGIGRESWYPVGGGESAHIAFDPDDPRLVYATSINGTVTEYDVETGVDRSVRPYPEYVFGIDAKHQKYRANWNAPVVVSPHDPRVIYYGAQVLLRSRDRGLTWEEASGDLTRDDAEKQGLGGGPITNEQAGVEFYNTIFTITPSPHEPGTIWVGSDDGLVHVTRDGGATWTNVTPADAGEALVNSIEVSPHDPAAAYVAVAGYKLDDFTPRVYATSDYGGSWRKTVAGLPEDTFARAVREDPDRRGLLYAATETGVFVSFDDGGLWQSLQLDLPEVPVTDLTIRRQDLVASTQGRGFWVLDDLTPLHQFTAEVAAADVYLYEPRDAWRLGGGGGFGPPTSGRGKNPPRGAVIHYVLKEERDEDATPIVLEILDARDAVIRVFSSAETELDACVRDNTEPRNRDDVELLDTGAGMSRWVWDLRRAPLYCLSDVRLFQGWEGARVVPGTYKARLTVDARVEERTFEVLPDPREQVTPEQFAELDAYLGEVTELFNALMEGLEDLRRARSQIEERLELTAQHPRAAELEELGRPVVAEITAWEEQVVQPRHETYDDDINWRNMLNVQVAFLRDEAEAPLTAGARQRLAGLESRWRPLDERRRAILGGDVAAFNQRLAELGIPVIYVARSGGSIPKAP